MTRRIQKHESSLIPIRRIRSKFYLYDLVFGTLCIVFAIHLMSHGYVSNFSLSLPSHCIVYLSCSSDGGLEVYEYCQDILIEDHLSRLQRYLASYLSKGQNRKNKWQVILHMNAFTKEH